MNGYVEIHYGVEAMQHLIQADRALAPYVEKYGRVGAKRNPDIFAVLVAAIIADGVTAATAIAVESRMKAACGGFTAANVLKTSAGAIRDTGLSQAKAAVIADLSGNIAAGRLDLNDTLRYDDEECVKFIAGIKGVGRNVAETVAIFGEGRLDVFLYGDAVFQKAVMQVHGYTSYSKERHERLKKLYSPYGTLATFYYFAIAEALPRGSAR